MMSKMLKKYYPYPLLVMRFPRYPLDFLLNCIDDEELMREVFSTVDFKNAILFSSPSLFQELKHLLAGQITNVKRKKKVELSLFKYLTRMSCRCTPFASLASCGCVKWGDNQDVKPDRSRLERFRLDMLYLCVLSQRLIKDHGIREHLSFRVNETIYQLGQKVRYITYSTNGKGRKYQVNEVGMTRLLKYILRMQNGFISFMDLTEQMCESFALDADAAKNYLHILIDHQLLVSEIDPFVTGDDVLGYLTEKITPFNKQWGIILQQLQSHIISLSSNHDISDNELHHQRIKQIVDSNLTKSDSKYLVQLDLFSSHDQECADKRILNQIKSGMDFLCRTTTKYYNGNLDTFKRRFVLRYQDQEIPLLEALDPDVGVGYVFTQDKISNPLIDPIRLPIKKSSLQSVTLTPLQQILLHKMSNQNWRESHHISLTEADIAHLPLDYSDLPVTMSALFKIIRQTGDKDYLLSELRFTGASAANLLGRFAYGDRNMLMLIKQITHDEQEITKDKIIAEIAHVPQSRTGNILSRPHIRDYEINYLANPQIDDAHRIDVRDLMVSVKDGHVILRSRKLGKQVLPRLTTAHNYSGTDTSPVYRFLCDLQHQHGRSSLLFIWGALSKLEHLPRVMYKNIIFSNERWLIRCEHLPFKRGGITLEKLQEWTKSLRLPKYVQLVAGDNKLLVDTAAVISVEAMLSELGNAHEFILEEFIPCQGVTRGVDNKDYMNECIVPMVKR